jgi:hypothetical protein
MKKLNEFLPLAEILVNELAEQIDSQELSLKSAEEKILEFVYRIGHSMLVKVVRSVKEPTQENRVKVEGKTALYKDMQNLAFKNRFGERITRRRRRYAIEGESKGYYPLDEKLGLDQCGFFSPLMTYLMAFFGGCEAYGPAAKRLSKALGFDVSSTAVQNNTEMTGRRIEHHPFKAIPGKKQSETCDLMLVQIDGTMSPQIHEEQGITGRESLKQPTEYKECNVVAIEKNSKTTGKSDRWVGAQYGSRDIFENYVRQTALKMGQLLAKDVVFLADGAKHNWEIQKTNFPDATPILDFYHALEHLADFCSLIPKEQTAKHSYAKWRAMLYEGDVYQILEEMKESRESGSKDSDEAQKHINYFQNNKWRMQYQEYRAKGYPIGSGLVEGQCKLVVGKRFKGNGMRWKKADNMAVLDDRLAVLNNTLDTYFVPKPREFQIAS